MSKEKQYVSFNFALGQVQVNTPPIVQDNEKIIFDHLSKETQKFMKSLENKKAPLATAQAIKSHIITTKKYSTKVQ